MSDVTKKITVDEPFKKVKFTLCPRTDNSPWVFKHNGEYWQNLEISYHNLGGPSGKPTYGTAILQYTMVVDSMDWCFQNQGLEVDKDPNRDITWALRNRTKMIINVNPDTDNETASIRFKATYSFQGNDIPITSPDPTISIILITP